MTVSIIGDDWQRLISRRLDDHATPAGVRKGLLLSHPPTQRALFCTLLVSPSRQRRLSDVSRDGTAELTVSST